ncbi:MAG: hypothetical protein ACPG4X_22650 [Pikeienuella sp.]
MPKLALIKRGAGLFPASKAAQITFDKIKSGVGLSGDVAQRRNTKFHRLYWAMCTYVAEALNSGPGDAEWTQEMVSDRLKVATGRADVIALPRSLQHVYGSPVAVKPQSISFAKMDDSEFGRFVESCIAYVLTEFGAWVQDHEDWKHVRDILNHATRGQAA